MWFRYADKLHNGDEVDVRKSATGKTCAVGGKVIKTYINPEQPKIIRIDVILHTGEYLVGLTHRDLV